MTDLTTVLDANRSAVEQLIAAAEQSGPAWTTPRAPGKWSPSQVVEHVARALEESAKVVAGEPSRLPSLPAFVRPLFRGLFFNRVVKNGRMPKARTNPAMNPAQGPPAPADARGRLETALASFDNACRERAATDQTFISGAFGTVSVVDYARFQEIHTRHHCKQIPGAALEAR